MTGKGKKEVVIDKEEISESCCFVCKDGGDLMICDYKDCLKCYHPCCVGKDDSFLESDDKWECDRHTCFQCGSSSIYLSCYTCKKSVCRNCLPAVKIFQIKGKYGFCDFCLSVVLLIEEKKDYDSDGEKVDFTDMETVEGFFVGYYHNIKDEEGFDSKDLYAAVERAKRRERYQSASDLEEDEEEEEEDDKEYKISDDDGTDDKSKDESLRSENSSKRMKSAKESNKMTEEKTRNGNDSKLEHHNITTADQPKEPRMEAKESEEMSSHETNNGQRASTPDLIGSGKFDDVESDRWCIKGPYGEQPENCSLSLLKLWSERSSYAFRFKVWRDDENEANAISLKEAISVAFPDKSNEDI